MSAENEHQELAPLYERLPTCCVRMLELQCGQPDEPVTARLFQYCMEGNNPTNFPYHALSYTWGSDKRDFPMVVNGTTILITTLLGDLLQQSRDILEEGQAVNWWIDQLCIDQNDDEDKAEQIPKMRSIYEKALHVVVWVNLDPGCGRLAIDLIHRLRALRRPDSGDSLEKLPLAEILGPLDPDNLRTWAAFEQLMQNEYWRRAWILPEVTARLDNSYIFAGSISDGLGIGAIFWARNVIRGLRTRELPPEYGVHLIEVDSVARVSIFADERDQVKLFELLHLTLRMKSTKAEDKIYPILPFATDVGRYIEDPFLHPSYTRGCHKTYTDLIKWYLMKYRNLSFLGYCTAAKKQFLQFPGFNLPSWVPNWTHNSYLRPFLRTYYSSVSLEDRAPLFKACGPFSYTIDIVEPPSTVVRPVSLSLSGLRIATVCEILPAVEDGSFWETDVEESWLSYFDHNSKYSLTGESYLDAFERTIIADIAPGKDGMPLYRPGKAKWWHAGTESSPADTRAHEILKSMTGDRRLFFARSSPSAELPGSSPSIHEEGFVQAGTGRSSFLLGLGRSDVEVGDQIWALKGGQMLYILRPHPDNEATRLTNAGSTGEHDFTGHSSILYLNGKASLCSTSTSRRKFKFVGESYVHGLMDGEALQFASTRSEERPGLLKDMAGDFEDILLGGETMPPDNSTEDDLENDWTVY